MAYFDKYGVEFSDDRKTLVRCPKNFRREYVIPPYVTDIGIGAFGECKGLTSIEIPSSVTNIGKYAFQRCSRLTSVEIPNSVSNIGDYTFSSCNNLTSVTIPNSVTSIGDSAFHSCSGLTSVTIPNSVTSIGDDAFFGCSGLTSVTIPNSVTSIGDSAFHWCSGLTSVTIPNSVTSIGDDAFFGCSGLTSVTIPNSVTSIGYGAFYKCSGLTTINVSNDNPNYIAKDEVLFNKQLTTLIQYPARKQGAYAIPNSVTSIRERAFEYCSGLTSVTIPNSVTSIGDWAFNGCSSLTSVTIPNSVTSIRSGAFYCCSGLKEIIVPRGQKARFEQMGGLKDLKDKIVERDNEELTVLFNLGKAYELGIGVTQSSAQAILYYVQAAEKGCTEAAFHLGEWYRDGKNVPQDEPKALDYFQQAAKSGFAKAAEQVNALKQSIAARKEEEERRLREKEEAKKRQEEKERLKWLELEQERQRQKAEQEEPYYLFFDTETTGVPQNYKAPITNSSNWPRLVQLAWLMADKNGNVLKKKSVIIKPDGFIIPSDSAAVHGITTERAQREGKPLREVLEEFATDLSLAEQVVGHNIDFDQHIVGAELYRQNMDYDALMDKSCICTMRSSTDFCAIPNPNSYYGGYKWPSLQELYRKLFNRSFDDAHDALADISATKDCFFELKRRGVI